DENGGVEGVILTLTDASERERHRQAAEMAHWRAQAQLEQRVRERTAALEAANSELEAFSYAVSHDLRAPLRAIKGFNSALQEDCGMALGEKGRMYLERIHNATQRMSEFIDGLLSLSMLNRSELQAQPVDLSQLAHDIILQLRDQEPSRTLDVHIEPGLSAVGDVALLGLLLQNLLDNAWKFTAPCAAGRIWFGRQPWQGREVFVIRDNGIGFETASASRLFHPFTRLHGQDGFEGSGIGLATVSRIVERHGGTVWAEGAPQQGAAFYFTLSTPAALPTAS
ncbi:MAG TPA: ATP-binding protein, partial [Gammaproteobacteria bacterium]